MEDTNSMLMADGTSLRVKTAEKEVRKYKFSRAGWGIVVAEVSIMCLWRGSVTAEQICDMV